MLKVTHLDNDNQRTLVVEGALAGASVSELEVAWRQVGDDGQNRKIVVDLSGATVIDAGGKVILTAMIREGVELVGRGIFTKYLVKDLMEKARQSQCRF